jgi:hypothetical protein
MCGASCGSPTGSPARYPRVDSASHDLAAGEAAHEASCPAQEFGIGSFISCKRGAQKPGKFGFVVAVQACLLPNTSARGLWLRGREKFAQAIALADNEVVSGEM